MVKLNCKIGFTQSCWFDTYIIIACEFTVSILYNVVCVKVPYRVTEHFRIVFRCRRRRQHRRQRYRHCLCFSLSPPYYISLYDDAIANIISITVDWIILKYIFR